MKSVQNVFRSQVGKVRIEMMPDPRYTDADGRRMVAIKITHNRVRYYIPTGQRVDDSETVKLWGANKGEWYRKRNDCTAFMRRVEDEVRVMVSEGRYDFAELKKRMDGRHVELAAARI